MRVERRKRIKIFRGIVVFGFILAAVMSVTSLTQHVFSEKAGTEAGMAGFDRVPYYLEENAQRYLSYSSQNPNLKEEDVVWQVNADMDKESYSNANVIEKGNEDKRGVLVNKHNRLRNRYEPYSLVTSLSGILVTPDTADAIEKMSQDASYNGLNLQACSGYRSFEKQEEIYERYKRENGREYADNYSARPQFSEHHTGRAIDLISPAGITDDFESTAECKWVHKNAWKYGFILRYPKGSEEITGYSYEPWHITYVGTEISKKMKKEGIDTLEEYWGKYMV